MNDLAGSMPFSRAVQAACAKLGACALPCPFPRCECELVPGAVRDAIHEWVHALPAGGTALPTDGADSDPLKVRE